jgi:N-acetylglucosaminyldiphosphoundecaprenol N-acetyl-beta-D-mannosaminyltransferase
MTAPLEFLPGIRVHPLTLSELNEVVANPCEEGRKHIIANHNLHSIYLYYHDPKMRAFYEAADYVHADGMGVVLLARLLGMPLRREHRITYTDWLEPLVQMAIERAWRVFYVGSKPGIAERGAAVLRKRFPALQITTAPGYFDARPESPENESLLQEICQYRPHILMVGMGMPRQEHWILDNRDRIPANIILPAGAAIDYVAGAIPTPPRWAGRIGLEWSFRLFSEPQRLWRRYLLEPWFVMRLVLVGIFRGRAHVDNSAGLTRYQPERSDGPADN